MWRYKTNKIRTLCKRTPTGVHMRRAPESSPNDTVDSMFLIKWMRCILISFIKIKISILTFVYDHGKRKQLVSSINHHFHSPYLTVYKGIVISPDIFRYFPCIRILFLHIITASWFFLHISFPSQYMCERWSVFTYFVSKPIHVWTVICFYIFRFQANTCVNGDLFCRCTVVGSKPQQDIIGPKSNFEILHKYDDKYYHGRNFIYRAVDIKLSKWQNSCQPDHNWHADGQFHVVFGPSGLLWTPETRV